MYVGVTGSDWFRLLKEENRDEVNFWTPGDRSFKALDRGELFLFKLHSPENYIVGGGYFVCHTVVPASYAWATFGRKNGASSLQELKDSVEKYRERNQIAGPNTQIGCVTLTHPFFFAQKDWIPIPENWNLSTPQGRVYSTDEPMGKQLYQDVQKRLASGAATTKEPPVSQSLLSPMGEGAFRMMVTEAYQRRCAITGEKTLPVLRVAQIKPQARGGRYEVQNGILLRSDLCVLYEDGYLTIDKYYRMVVSRRLKEDYGDGEVYRSYSGKELMILPEHFLDRPARELLEWHNEQVFLG